MFSIVPSGTVVPNLLSPKSLTSTLLTGFQLSNFFSMDYAVGGEVVFDLPVCVLLCCPRFHLLDSARGCKAYPCSYTCHGLHAHILGELEQTFFTVLFRAVDLKKYFM